MKGHFPPFVCASIFLRLLVIFLVPLASVAQTGSISGTIADSGGAVVLGAQVTARDMATNAARETSTSASGTYSLTDLPVGAYELTIVKTGLKASKVSGLQLTVAQALTVNAKLEPGAVSEEVEVRGDQVPDIDLETSQLSNMVDSRKMQDLPLITRDPYQLVLLSPGTMQSNSVLGGFSVNGARERNNNFLLDGVDNNDTSVPGIAGGLTSLNPDATQEFRIITNNFMPEYGRNNGAIVDVVTKSGTNAFHGDAYWFGRYNALGARDYFNHNPDINDPSTVEPQNPYVRNQFGFSLGGPIRKDKTFFFVNNEWQRFRTTVTDAVIVPTRAFKSGVFDYTATNAQDCGNMPAPCTVHLDLTDPASPNNPFGFTPSAFMKNILNLYPDPNGPAVDSTRGYLLFPSRSAQDSWNLTTKIDHHITARQTLSLSYDYNTSKDPDPFHDEFLPGLGATAVQTHTQLLGAGLTSTLTSRLVNEARFGFNKADLPFNCSNLKVLDSFGGQDAFGRARDFTLPGITGFGCGKLSDSDGQWRRTGTWSWGDSLSWVKGGHTLKFAAEFRRVYDDGYNSFQSRDTLTFAGRSDSNFPFVDLDPSTPCDTDFNSNTFGSGCEGPALLQNMASMLFGIADTETQAQFFNKAGVRTANDTRDFRQHEYDFYVQDSWKLRSNLTLNLGARYQFNGVPFETNNNFSNLFADPSGFAPFTFQLVGPGTGHLLYDNDYSSFEPRLGFAWDPFKQGKTSVRGGFGIFHDRVFGNLFGNARGNPPFQETFFGTHNFGLPFATPDNIALPSDQVSSPVVQDGAGTTPVIFPRRFPMPYSQAWNFGVEHEFAPNLAASVFYVGNHGVHGLRVVDGNPPDPALVAQNFANVAPGDVQDFAAHEQFSNLWFGGPGFQATRNNAFYQTATNQASMSSSYNALQAKLTRKLTHGLQVEGAYTYSHAIDDGSDPIYPTETNRSYPRDSFELYNERGNSGFDVRHRLVVNYVWELPFGKGREFVSSGVPGKVLEGWQLSGITSYQTGIPFDVFGNIDAEHTGLSSRLDLVGNPSIPAGHDRTETGPPASAFAYADPVLGLPGNVGRNRFYGPSYYDWDMVVAKTTKLRERFELQTRFEFYNVFNRVQFDEPDNLLQDGLSFGHSSATLTRSDGTTSARQLQFGMKLKF